MWQIFCPWSCGPGVVLLFMTGFVVLRNRVQILVATCCQLLNSFRCQKADNKIYFCKFSKSVKSKCYHIESSKTRGQIV